MEEINVLKNRIAYNKMLINSLYTYEKIEDVYTYNKIILRRVNRIQKIKDILKKVNG